MFTLAPRNGDTASSTIQLEVYTHQGTEFLRQTHIQVDYQHNHWLFIYLLQVHLYKDALPLVNTNFLPSLAPLFRFN